MCAIGILPEAENLFASLNISATGHLLESSCDIDDRILWLRNLAEYGKLDSDYSITDDLFKLLPPLF